jgi:hypothetical protein
MINKLVNYGDDDKQDKKNIENPYSYLFGEYDFRSYNTKVPLP